MKILPWTGYGNADLIRQIINSEKPDAILHFTDPRYWVWLYEMEHEIRQNIPIMFYAIWDDLPDPLYNRNYYESCDWIGCISRQTYGIVSRLTSRTDKPTWKPHSDWQVSYVPHGINPDEYKPVDVPVDFKSEILKEKEYDFIFFLSNRNIRRKQPSDLIMHTQPTDQNGTDLPRLVKHLTPDANVIFSDKRRSTTELNYLYNMSDCTINIAGNEGFGLTTAESVMAGTPIIVNVTGGLQDQCGFKKKSTGEYFTAEDYKQIGSLHDWREWEDVVTWGEWATPIWSRAHTMAGSIPTPYIWDDKIDIYELSEKMEQVYNTSKDKLKENGLKGREAFIGEMGLVNTNMCQTLVDGVEGTFENWKPRKTHELFNIN